jgi:hypothetical protein
VKEQVDLCLGRLHQSAQESVAGAK